MSKKPIVVTADSIRNVRKNLVTITRNHNDERNPYTTIDLPIEPELFPLVLQATTASPTIYADWLPFIFICNENGKAFDFMPREEYKKRKAQENNTQTSGNNSPNLLPPQ